MVGVSESALFPVRLAESNLDNTFYYGLLDGKDEQPDYSDIRPMYASV